MSPTTATPSAESKRTPRKQPETLRIRTITPSFTVNDLKVSIAWYRDILGFLVADEIRHEGQLVGAVMRAGAAELILGQDDFAKGKDRKKGVGFRIHCRSVQDIDSIAQAVEKRGGVFEQPPTTHLWGIRDFTVVDPDGYKISIGNWEGDE